ncbi:NRDE family protein [Ferruginibacter sp.]
MCTVSYVPIKDGYVFTFNRDEDPNRYTPHFITRQKLLQKEIFYAKDNKAGGTWFATDSLGNAAMLFNGAFTRHQKKTGYAKSRGVILLQLVAAQNMLDYFDNENMHTIEPFSIILFENKNLYRLVWDGMNKHVLPMQETNAHIFSSATLYEENIQQLRKEWLAEFMQQQIINSEALLHFHSNYKNTDKQNGMVIERPGGCSTLSISQAVITQQATVIKHVDLKTGMQYQQQILLN